MQQRMPASNCSGSPGQSQSLAGGKMEGAFAGKIFDMLASATPDWRKLTTILTTVLALT